MPIYEYECQHCQHHFDLIQKMLDAPATQCPKCFEHSVIRLMSASGFQLKGTGWYATDFKDKKENKSKDTGKDSTESVKKMESSDGASVSNASSTKTDKTGDAGAS